jgi:flavin reductase (DIM6/NTAB) family NADH-FMN oxidoreductase RutF
VKDDATDKQLAAALGRLASGLYVLTVTRDQAETGMLVSWVQQCSFHPPRLSVALSPGRFITSLLQRDARFTLNVLEAGQKDMIAHFGRGFSAGEDAFANVEVERDWASGPILSDALAAMECRVVERFAGGDHDLFVAEVVGGKLLGDGQPMIHVRKSGLHY